MSTFSNEELKVIIIMMKRASCTGEESGAVASVIMKAESVYLAHQPEEATPETDEEEGAEEQDE